MVTRRRCKVRSRALTGSGTLGLFARSQCRTALCQDDVGAPTAEDGTDVLNIDRAAHLVTRALEHRLREVQADLAVIDQEYLVSIDHPTTNISPAHIAIASALVRGA